MPTDVGANDKIEPLDNDVNAAVELRDQNDLAFSSSHRPLTPIDGTRTLAKNIVCECSNSSLKFGDHDALNIKEHPHAPARHSTSTGELAAIALVEGSCTGTDSASRIKRNTASQKTARANTTFADTHLTASGGMNDPTQSLTVPPVQGSQASRMSRDPRTAIKIEPGTDSLMVPQITKTASKGSKTGSASKKRISLTEPDFTGNVERHRKRIRTEVTPAEPQDNDLPVPNATVSTTIGAQTERIKAQAYLIPGVDMAQVNRDDRALQQARGAFGRKNIKPVDDKWLVKGMKTPLMHHQLYAAAWMIRREESQEPPFGGLLADMMGFRKTLMCLAVIKTHQIPKASGCDHITLVLVPNATAIEHWREQISTHCPILSFRRYTRKTRFSASDLARCDVLCTTYSEMLRTYTSDPSLADDILELFEVDFGRIILDECHETKNHRAKTAAASFALQAKYKWCCSATPIPNGAKELYPYMRFIGLPGTESMRKWNATYGNKAGTQGQKRLDQVMKNYVTRRDHESEFFCTPILNDLPQRHILPSAVVAFSEEEKFIYELVRREYRVCVNKHLSDSKTTGKSKKSHILALTTRLRQLTSHVFLLEGAMRDELDLKSIGKMRTQLEGKREKKPLIDQIGRWCTNTLEGGTGESPSKTPNFGRGRHGLEFDMTPQLKMLEAVRLKAESNCSKCGEPSTDGVMAECGHGFHDTCLEKVLALNSRANQDPALCVRCDKPLGRCTPIEAARDVNDSYGMWANPKHDKKTSNWTTASKKKRQQTRGNDYNGVQPKGEQSSFLEESDRNPSLPLTPSAKTTTVKDIILSFQADAPEDKIIIFTQWITMARIIGRVLEDEKIPFVYLVGELNEEQRQKSIDTFKKVPKAKVMVASLQCGAQSLDLTCANRVILVDPWWNKDKEDQAFSRVYRIGQKKETYCVRIVVKDSVDDKMNDIQRRKTAEIDRTLQGVDDNDKDKLEIYELVSIFGRVRGNGESGMVVESDDDMD